MDSSQRYTRTGRFIRQLLSGDGLIGEEIVSDQKTPYVIISKIGEGGMGKIYKARSHDQKEVAIKITTVEQGMKRFQLETAVLKLLGGHPNLPQLFDWGLQNEQIKFCVMEYVEGWPMDTVVKKRPAWFYDKPLANTLEVALLLLQALSHVHRKKVVHRDIKPHNIIINKLSDGSTRLKLMDFGVAKTLEKGFLSFLHKKMTFDERTLTLPGQPIGTLGYAPKEQIDNGPLSESADIFACGITLIEIARGGYFFLANTISSYLRTLDDFVFEPLDFPGESDYVAARFNEIIQKSKIGRAHV